MSGLAARQRVYYVVGDAKYGWTAEASFLTAPAPLAAVELVAFGDLGQFPLDDALEQEEMIASRNTTDNIAAGGFGDAVLHIGDISYARGYVSQWDQFHDQIAPLAARLPWMVGIGNHERDWPSSGSRFNSDDSGGEAGVAYEKRFRMPTPGADKPYWRLLYGSLYFIMLSTEHAFDPSSEQYAFVKDSLAQAPPGAWRIVCMHRPFYIDSTNKDPVTGDQTVAAALRASFEDMFRSSVHVILDAHHHSYQRTCPVYQGKCQPAGTAPVVVDVGMAGAGSSTNLEPFKPDFFEFVDDHAHGYTKISANQTTFLLEFVNNVNRRVEDSFVLTK